MSSLALGMIQAALMKNSNFFSFFLSHLLRSLYLFFFLSLSHPSLHFNLSLYFSQADAGYTRAHTHDCRYHVKMRKWEKEKRGKEKKKKRKGKKEEKKEFFDARKRAQGGSARKSAQLRFILCRQKTKRKG